MKCDYHPNLAASHNAAVSRMKLSYPVRMQVFLVFLEIELVQTMLKFIAGMFHSFVAATVKLLKLLYFRP